MGEMNQLKKFKNRPDVLSLVVYLVLATVNVALLYFMAYAPEEITLVAGWPLWYLVCCVGGGIVFLAVSAWIIFKVYKDSDFTLPGDKDREGSK